MARTFRSLALTGHILMAAQFALGTVACMQIVFGAWRGADGGWSLVLPILATLGFISLTAREVRILVVARRGRRESDSDARPG